MCKLVTDTELISDFKLYLLEFLNRFLGSQITPINLNDLKQTVRFAFDKMVNYEKIGSENNKEKSEQNISDSVELNSSES